MNISRSQTPQSDSIGLDSEITSTYVSPSPENELDPEPNVIIPRPRKFILTKYTIYFTTQRMYIVGSNSRESVFRILEIDLVNTDKLTIMEDNVYFTRNEIMEVLNGIEDSSEGGLTKRLTAVGLLGFIKFTKHYYLLVVTKRKEVAVLGSHEIYHIDETELIPVANNAKAPEKKSVEERYVQTFLNIDLSKSFYYSYSYDLTNSLQTNMLRNKRQSLNINGNMELFNVFEFNERFMWNLSLLEPVSLSFDKVYDWFQPIIHGFIDQVKNSVFEIQFYITLIARRSHHFAGARFFKRGVNDDGDVANEVETEQIVCDMLTSSFHDPAAGFYNNPRYTSFVQHRGSIPLSWSQDTAPNLRMAKPPIELDVIDPFYSRAALHLNNLFARYGAPIQILNLIKQKEKTPRETILLDAFNSCIEYLNQFLPVGKKMDYTAWDMSRAAKSRSQDVIQWLESYSEYTLNKTGFFHNGKTIYDTQLQQGICRTNCVDCLDRTNTAQFVIGKRALGHQLNALGIIKEKYLEYDSDVTNVLTEMFHDHGDTIALQYGGSHLVNTLQTYRKINQWSSHSRDMIESVKRFYSNSFMDAQRQEAINLFLGNYVHASDRPMLWEMNTDYYLHNKKNNSELNGTNSYTHWFDDTNLIDRKENVVTIWESSVKNKFLLKLQEKQLFIRKIDPYIGCFENYWNIKYGERNFVSLNELFEFNMNSTSKYSTHIDQKSLINYSSPKPTMTENGSSGFGILSIFKKKEEKIQSETHKRFNSFSDRLRRNSMKHIFDAEYEEENYFSPFKSRKPHRELQLIYSMNKNENVIIEEDNSDPFPIFHELAKLMQYNLEDDEEKEHYIQDYKGLMLSLHQLKKTNRIFDVLETYFTESVNILNKLYDLESSTLPVIKFGRSDLENIGNEMESLYIDDDVRSLKSEERDRHRKKIDTHKNILKSDMINFGSNDLESENELDSDSLLQFEKTCVDVHLLSHLVEQYGVVLPTVEEPTVEFYKNFVCLTEKIPVFGMNEFCKERETNNVRTGDESNIFKGEDGAKYNQILHFVTQNEPIDTCKTNDLDNFNQRKINALVDEYKQLTEPIFERGASDKCMQQVQMKKREQSTENEQQYLVPDVIVFDSNGKDERHNIPNEGNATDEKSNMFSSVTDTADSDHYFNFRLLGKKLSRSNLRGGLHS